MKPRSTRPSAATRFACISALLLAALAQCATFKAADAVKVDCYPIDGATKEKCESLGCIWSPVNASARLPDTQVAAFEPLPSSLSDDVAAPRVNVPWCYHPDGGFARYKVTSYSKNFISLARARPSVMGDADVQSLKITIKPYNSGKVLRLTIEDAQRQRFVPRLPVLNLNSAQDNEAAGRKTKDDDSEFLFELEPAAISAQDPQVLTIRRASTRAVLFSTDLGKLIFADRFIQLNSALSSPFVYGLGEHYDTFLKYANAYKVYSFWNTDKLPQPGGTRSYGSFPFLINLDSANQTQAHGIYLHNTNAMDIVLQSDVSITFRPVGGILDFFLFSGPSPLDVTRQFQELVGMPTLPPRWALGFHLCRYNYNSLERTRLIWKRTRDAGIPFDVQWNDVDALGDANDFSVNNETFSGLPEFVDELHALNMHYIPLVDPGISQQPHYRPYELGTQMDIWIKNATGGTLVGRVWNKSGRTVFPDFSLEASHEYWKQMFIEYQSQLKIDGAWIDMNDISSFVDGSLDGCPWASESEKTPYRPGGYNLQTKTLCLSAAHSHGLEYDLHNLYSSYEAIATKSALEASRPGQRAVIISRSSFPGQGAHSGHWSGDVKSTWGYLRWSIPSLLEHSMYGFSLMGADICGFEGNTTVELCARWQTLGAFYTFSRNHNDDVSIDQDPVALGPQVVGATKNAITKRYSLMPYLYTLVYRAHKFGEPVARSVGFEFFDQHDKEALKVEHQFMWGRAVMISPVVFESTYEKATYLPEGRWYETDILPESMSFDLSQYKVPRMLDAEFGATDWHKTSNISLVDMPIFYRGGHIIPAYAQVKATIADTELEQPLALEIALCQKGRAKGEIYLDGDSLEAVTSHVVMSMAEGTLKVELASDDYKKDIKFGHVRVLGVTDKIVRVEAWRESGDNKMSLRFQQKDHVVIFDLKDLAPLSKGSSIFVKLSSS